MDVTMIPFSYSQTTALASIILVEWPPPGTAEDVQWAICDWKWVWSILWWLVSALLFFSTPFIHNPRSTTATSYTWPRGVQLQEQIYIGFCKDDTECKLRQHEPLKPRQPCTDYTHSWHSLLHSRVTRIRSKQLVSDLYGRIIYWSWGRASINTRVPHSTYIMAIVTRPSFWWVGRHREKESQGNNPQRKCPDSRNSATGACVIV